MQEGNRADVREQATSMKNQSVACGVCVGGRTAQL